MVLLSICIPTRNRPAVIKKTLDFIIAQIHKLGLENEIEIIVADNTDAVSEKINPESIKYPLLRYFNNKGNIGYYGSINKMTKSATGTYAWYLSDDDILADDAIAEIISALKDTSREINYLTFLSGGMVRGEITDEDIYFKGLDCDYFSDGLLFMQRYFESVIFISTNIFHVKKLNAHADKYNLFNNYSSAYQNSLLCLSFIGLHGNVRIIRKTILYDNLQAKTYTEETAITVPVLGYIEALHKLEAFGFKPHAYEAYRKSVRDHVLHCGLTFSIGRIETPQRFDYRPGYRSIMCDSKLEIRTRLYALFVYVLLHLPKMAAKVCIRTVFTFKSPHFTYSRWAARIKESHDSLCAMKNRIDSTY